MSKMVASRYNIVSFCSSKSMSESCKNMSMNAAIFVSSIVQVCVYEYDITNKAGMYGRKVHYIMSQSFSAYHCQKVNHHGSLKELKFKEKSSSVAFINIERTHIKPATFLQIVNIAELTCSFTWDPL